MIILIVAILLLASWWLPWWFLAIFSLFFGYVAQSVRSVLIQLPSGVFVAWMMVSYFMDLSAGGRVSGRLANGAASLGFALPALGVYPLVSAIGVLIAVVFGLLAYEIKTFRAWDKK